MIILLVTQQM